MNISKLLESALLTTLGIMIGVVVAIVGIAVAIAAMVSTNMNETVELAPNTALEINASEAIINSQSAPTLDRLMGMATAQREVTLFDMLRAIECAATDPKIKLISLRMDGNAPMSLVAAHELRQALVRFRNDSGKPIYAYAEDYSQTEYYLASVADFVFIHPLGSIEWRGVAMNALYYGELIERLGVEVDVFRPEDCIYKSAVEPYTRSSMSAESRAQSQNIVKYMWQIIMRDVSHNRGVSCDILSKLAADEVLIDDSTARHNGLAIRSIYENDYTKLLAIRDVAVEHGAPRTISLAKYSAIAESVEPEVTGDHLALIYADGVIGVDKEDYTGVSAERLSRLIRRVAEDSSVKGVLLRVDSPGGGAIASDVVAREVERLTDVKKVVVSMGSVAASGGYYISTPADQILASPFTITGSIGVYGLGMDLEKALGENLYIKSDGVVSSPSADFGSSLRGVNSVERRAMMRSVNNIYDEFKSIVATTRDLAPDVVDTLSQGRVWCAGDARWVGLIDDVGGLYTSIKHLEKLTEPLPIREWHDMPEGWMAIVNSLSSQGAHALWRSAVGSEVPQLINDELRQLLSIEGGTICYSPLRVAM